MTDSPPQQQWAWEQRWELRADPSALSQPCLCRRQAPAHTCSGISLHSSTIRGFSGVVGKGHSDPQNCEGDSEWSCGGRARPSTMLPPGALCQPRKEASRNPSLPSVCPRKAAQDLRVMEVSQRVYMTVVNSQSPLRICRKRGHTIAMALSRVQGLARSCSVAVHLSVRVCSFPQACFPCVTPLTWSLKRWPTPPRTSAARTPTLGPRLGQGCAPGSAGLGGSGETHPEPLGQHQAGGGPAGCPVCTAAGGRSN